MPLVSVIIPVYNAGALITRCLDSVFSQVGSIDFEVIAIDDGSTDNSIEIIENHPRISVIKIVKQSNSGPSKARNKGIELASGKYLTFLDADDYWLPDFVQTTVRFLEENTECIAVSVAQRHLTTSGEHEVPTNWESLSGATGIVLNDFYAFWAEYNHVCTGSIMIKSDIAKMTKGQREDLRICEDLEYWALLATYGKIGYIPKLLFVSDGAKVAENIGWVQKHLPRWKAAVTVENWEKRILSNNPLIHQNEGYIKARGRIARNLAYSILMSKRYNIAKGQITRYSNTFPVDNMTMLMRIATMNSLNWFIVSRFLIYREYHRK